MADFPAPKGWAEVKKTYGSFKWTELSGGNVDIDDTWEHDNLIILRDVAGTGLSIQLHYKVAPLFADALAEAVKRCPKYKIKQLGGHCARHMMHDPKKPLSLHAWGCAFDINWDKNPAGPTLVTDLPPQFVAAFVERGWDWGGNWRSFKDSMHFQYATGV